MQQFNDVEVFVVVAEAASFAQAAERLHLTRSAVGKAVARLEEGLGVRLIHRTTRSQSLTAEGETFLARVKGPVEEIREAEIQLREGRRRPAGRLKVSAPVLFGRHIVTPILLDLVSAEPDLELAIAYLDRPVDLVSEGFDLAVRVGPLQDTDALTTRWLATQRMSLSASSSYLDHRGRPRHRSQLSGHTEVSYREGTYSWQIGEFGSSKMRLKPRLVLQNLEAVADAAAKGHGVALLPSWLQQQYVRERKLEPVLPGRAWASAEVHALWPRGRFTPSKVRAAIDLLVERIPQSLASEENPESDD